MNMFNPKYQQAIKWKHNIIGCIFSSKVANVFWLWPPVTLLCFRPNWKFTKFQKTEEKRQLFTKKTPKKQHRLARSHDSSDWTCNPLLGRCYWHTFPESPWTHTCRRTPALLQHQAARPLWSWWMWCWFAVRPQRLLSFHRSQQLTCQCLNCCIKHSLALLMHWCITSL